MTTRGPNEDGENVARAETGGEEGLKERGPEEEYRLKPFAADVSLLRQVKQRGRGRATIAVALMSLFLLLVVDTILEGSFAYSPWPNIILDDTLRFFGRYDGRAISQPDFPLMRDSISLAIITVQLGNTITLFKQWEAFSDLFPDLVRTEVVEFRDSQRVKSVIGNANTFYESVGRISVIPLILCVAGAAWSYRGLESVEIFGAFAPTDLNSTEMVEWQQQARDSWWAGSSSEVGRFIFIGLIAVFIYWTILQNFIGFHLCLLLWRTKDEFVYSVDPLNADGLHGWSPVGRVLKSVYTSLVLNLMTLMLAVFALQGRSIGNLTPLLSIYLLAAMAYLAIPALVMREGFSRMVADRMPEIKNLYSTGMDDFEEADQIVMESQLRAKVEYLHAAPVLPIRWKGAWIFFVAGVPAVVALLQLVIWAFSE